VLRRRPYLLLLLVLTVLHVVLAASLPVSGDEAYYWDCSRHPDWSYFDQPALALVSIAPFRALLGETSLAVRAPAVVASLLIGLFLLPLMRRLGGGEREAALAYGLLHGMPLFFIGSFYASTDIVLAAAWVGATWAAVALAQGERRAWWGFGAAVGLGFLAKFPIVLVALALAPALAQPSVRRDLRTPTPYLAALLSVGLTFPVWVWALQHDWANIVFQLSGRHSRGAPGLGYLAEFAAANLLLATPFLAMAALVAWWRGWRGADAGRRVLLVSAAAPFLVFGLVALRERVAGHWGGPGLLIGAVLLALAHFRWRRGLIVAGMAVGLVLSLAIVSLALWPEALLGLDWSYRGRPHRISTRKVSAMLYNREIAQEVAARLGPGELVASESYSTVHLLAFLSKGTLPTRLAHVKSGKHGLASLYWHRPGELRGRDMLFVTGKMGVDEPLRQIFESVSEEAPLVFRREGEVVRTVRLLRCRNLLHPENVFTVLTD